MPGKTKESDKGKKYTTQQLLDLCSSPGDGWIGLRNDATQEVTTEAEVAYIAEVAQGTKKPPSGAADASGNWKIHISIHPEDMPRAIPILHTLFNDPETPLMGMKIATQGALALEDHQSSKEVALIFDKVAEQTKEGQQKIILFLAKLGEKFSEAGIRPDPKPPLTVDTVNVIRESGSTIDKRNLENNKYDAKITFKEGEPAPYFYYRDELMTLIADTVYDAYRIDTPRHLRSQLVKVGDVDQLPPQYKHNPTKRTDDFLYGVILEKKLEEREALRKQELNQLINDCETYAASFAAEKLKWAKKSSADLEEPQSERAKNAFQAITDKEKAINLIKTELEKCRDNKISPNQLLNNIGGPLQTLATRRDSGGLGISAKFWQWVDQLRAKVGLPQTTAGIRGVTLSKNITTYFQAKKTSNVPEAPDSKPKVTQSKG